MIFLPLSASAKKVVPGLDLASLGLVVEDPDRTPGVGQAIRAFRVDLGALGDRVDVLKALQRVHLCVVQQSQLLHDVAHMHRRKNDIVAGCARLDLGQHLLIGAVGVEGNLDAGVLGETGQDFRVYVVAPVVDVQFAFGP